MADDTEEEAFNYLSTTKILLGIADTSKDVILQAYLDLTKSAICNYCNISTLPSALNYTLCIMTADTYREVESKNNIGSVVGNVTSISEGGRSVGFSGIADFKVAVEDKVAHKTELNRFRKLYRL